MDYSVVPGGTLKLKGGVLDGGIKKKKGKKSKSKSDKVKQLREEHASEAATESSVNDPSSSSQRLQTGMSNGDDRKTDAERRFEEVRRQRQVERIAKLASKTHKDRVHEFNEKLEALSEHHDIPKVGPG